MTVELAEPDAYRHPMTEIRPELLQQIDWILEHEGEVPEGVDAGAFFLEILPLLGSTDGPLRERKVLAILYTWIVRGRMPDDGLRDLARVVADEDHLFLDIGAEGEDSVYMRAFAAYLLSAFVRRHRESGLLAPEDLRCLADASVRYLKQERDLRGYVSPEAMWAHAIAHIADTVGALANCEELDADDLQAMLDAIGRALTTDAAVFIHEEDTRAADAVLAILSRNLLSNDRVAAWLESVVPPARYDGELPNVHHRYVNARNFLRCLYFQAQTAESSESAEPLVELVRDALTHLPGR